MGVKRRLPAFAGSRKILTRETDFSLWLGFATEFGQQVDLYRPRGELPVYAYPPWFLLPWWILNSVPDWIVKLAFGVSQGLASVLLVHSVQQLAVGITRVRPWHWIAFAVPFGRTIDQNLTHGQMSLWVAALSTRAVLELMRRRGALAGGFMGLATAMKLTPLLFLTDFHVAMIQPLFETGSGLGNERWTSGEHNARGTLSVLLQDVTTREGEPTPRSSTSPMPPLAGSSWAGRRSSPCC